MAEPSVLPGYHYSSVLILLAVSGVVESGGSFRGVAQGLSRLSRWLRWGSPSYSSIRHWVLRVGLYALQRPRASRTDWLTVVDMTLELGPHKCLVMLGIAQSAWQQLVETEAGALSYEMMECLGLVVLSHGGGETIYQSLETLTQAVGVPRQVVSDHGSDLSKGIRLYQEAHPEVQVTYDVTHHCARLLKAELATDDTYQAFAQRCARTRQQLQQTSVSFLMPPVQRAKARYFNVDALLEWATQVMAYAHRQDFSLIDPTWGFDEVTYQQLNPLLDPDSLAALEGLKGRVFPHRDACWQAVTAVVPAPDVTRLWPYIATVADRGRRTFEAKLGWLSTYQTALLPYQQMLTLTRTVQRLLKHHGLTHDSQDQFIQETQGQALVPRALAFRERILTYLEQETAGLAAQTCWLGSSDILESLFGTYKQFSIKSPLKHLSHLLLILPLLTVQLTVETIQTALNTISWDDVQTWYQDTFGPSPLAKRRAAFKARPDDTKLHELIPGKPP